MANYSRWDDIKKQRGEPGAETRAGVEQDLALGQLIYDLRKGAGISQRELAERMGTTQSVISRLEEGGGARNRIDTLARVATALDRPLLFFDGDGLRVPRDGRLIGAIGGGAPDQDNGFATTALATLA